MRNSKGYTLFELLISLGILGIIASLGFIYLSNYRRTTSLESEANKLVSYLRQTQNKAIAGDNFSNWGIAMFNPLGEGGDYYVVFEDAYSAASTTNTIYLNKSVSFNIPADNSSTTITFQRINGNTSSTTISLISNGDSSLIKTFSVNSLGQIIQ